jgi:hypothetical protein
VGLSLLLEDFQQDAACTTRSRRNGAEAPEGLALGLGVYVRLMDWGWGGTIC